MKLGDCWSEAGKEYEMFLLLVDQAMLEVVDEQDTLIVTLHDDVPVVTDLSQRQQLFQSAHKDWFNGRLGLWQKGKRTGLEIADVAHPLLFLFGDVAPWFNIAGKWYCWSAVRDITPTGLVIPGGSPISLPEVINYPYEIPSREGCEEMIIVSDEGVPIVFSVEHLQSTLQALKEMGISYRTSQTIGYTLQERPWAHARRLIIRVNGEEYDYENDVVVDPAVGAITLAQDWMVDYRIENFEQLRLYDGERGLDGKLLGRDIVLRDENGHVVVIYRNGQPIIFKPANLESIIDSKLIGRGKPGAPTIASMAV